MRASGRMDSLQGAFGYRGMRHAIGELLAQASDAGHCRFDGVSQLDDIVDRLARARAVTEGGVRLDDKSIGLTGSDRLDSSNPGAALALARELEYRTGEVLREELPVLSARRLFAVDSSIPVGAKTYTIERVRTSGFAKFWKAGGDIPLVDVGRDERSLKVAHAVIGVQAEFFEEQADAFAGINSYAEKVRAARRGMAEFENIVAWRGAESHGLYGILNFPWVQRVKLNGVLSLPTTDAQFEDRAEFVSGVFNDILDRNPGISASLSVKVAPRLHRRLTQSHHPSTQITLKQRIMADNPSIAEMVEAPELQGQGPGGATQDGMLITPSDPQLAPVIVSPVGFTMLPVQTSNFGLTRTQAGYQSLGGARYKEAMRSKLVWFDME